MTRAVLVIGYGNPLRTDDGLGWHAADDWRRTLGWPAWTSSPATS